MPPWRRTRPRKSEIAGDEVAQGSGSSGRARIAATNGVHPFVGIEMQLPRPGDGQVIDGPIALCAIVLESVLDHRRSEVRASSTVPSALKESTTKILSDTPWALDSVAPSVSAEL